MVSSDPKVSVIVDSMIKLMVEIPDLDKWKQLNVYIYEDPYRSRIKYAYQIDFYSSIGLDVNVPLG